MSDQPEIKKTVTAGLKRDRDLRRAMRFPTRFPAQVKAAGRTLSVTVHDISSVGAMVEGAELPEAGRRVTFEAVGVLVEANVAWSRETACGLEFREAVDPLDAVRKNVPALAQARGQRLPPKP